MLLKVLSIGMLLNFLTDAAQNEAASTDVTIHEDSNEDFEFKVSETITDFPIITETEEGFIQFKEFANLNVSDGASILDIKNRLHGTGYRKPPILRSVSTVARFWSKSSHGNHRGLVRIPYTIHSAFNREKGKYRKIIQKALSEFSKHTCVRFFPRNGQSNYVRFVNGRGCSADLGRGFGARRVTLNIPWCVTKGTILHEVMHILGFEHVHVRSDWEKYIKIDFKNIISGKAGNFRKTATRNLVVYDHGSILHYRRTAFTKSPCKRTIDVKPTSKSMPKIGQRIRLSPYDIEQIKYLYKCGSTSYERCGKDFGVSSRSGSFHSPNFPSPYPKLSHCTWKITTNRGNYVKVTFRDIDIQYSRYCQNDAILVHDGANAGAPTLRRICGNPSEVEVVSTGNQIFIMFSSDDKPNSFKGFNATFTRTSKRGKSANENTLLPYTSVHSKINVTMDSFHCNFDDGLCGMAQDDMADLDWVRLKPRAGLGSYLHVVIRDDTLECGDIAIIKTPWFVKRPKYCIKFRYGLFGSQAGTFSFHAIESSSDGKNRDVTLLRKSGNQGNKWHEADIVFKSSKTAQNVQFYWKIYRKDWDSDNAMDDISITTAGCDVDEIVEGTYLPYGLCSFEPKKEKSNIQSQSGTIPGPSTRDLGKYIYLPVVLNNPLCEWNQLTGRKDQFDWTLNRGKTSTTRTGPGSDYTSRIKPRPKNSGYYAYIESSKPRINNDVAILQTYSLFPSKYCVKMYYHMYGRSIGKLLLYAVEARKNGKQNTRMLHSIVGRQRGIWLNFKVDYIPANNINSVQFRIEGFVGRGIEGDIAIDDVSILPGTCSACSGSKKNFATGCVNADLFWVRCCKSNEKVIYRRVSRCNRSMFTDLRLTWYCSNL